MNYLRNGVYSWQWSRPSEQVGEGGGDPVTPVIILINKPSLVSCVLFSFIARYSVECGFTKQCFVLPACVFQPIWIKSSWLTRSRINS
jgi:hypothetical protein